MGMFAIPPGNCPSCGADLGQPDRRQRLTLAEVPANTRKRHRDLLQRIPVAEDDLLAWRCLACSTTVPAHDLTEPRRVLATRLRFQPTTGSASGAKSAACLTPSLYLGTPPNVPSTPADNVETAVAIISSGGTAALPLDRDDVARDVLTALGLCIHEVEDRLLFARTGRPGPPCDCVRQ